MAEKVETNTRLRTETIPDIVIQNGVESILIGIGEYVSCAAFPPVTK